LRRAALALVACAAIAHGETRPRYAGQVEATLLGAPATLDPALARSHAEATVAELVFDTLYRLDGDGEAQPHLALGPPVYDEKRTTVRIAIRKGVRFHDGSELTAQDVAASLERTRATAPWVLASVAEVRANGDAIELALRAPTPDLELMLALPQTAVTKQGKPPGDHPIGTGPFAVEAWDRARHRLKLRAFDDHFAGRPYVDLELRWYDTPDGEARNFETGGAQISVRGASAFAGGEPTYRAAEVNSPAAVLAFVGFGQAHAAITGDRAFRRALDLAIARGGLATIGSGEVVLPTRAPIPVEAGAPPLDAAARAGDLAGATAQLADAARRVPQLQPGRIATLAFEILVEDTRPDDRENAERVVRALDKLGIAATVSAVPAQQLRERVAAGSCDLWIGQLAEPLRETAAWYGAAFSAGNDDWATGQLAAGALDPAAAARAFAERTPIVPLMFRAVRMWHRTDLRGIAFDASGRPGYADMFFFGAPVRTRP